jgi:hypothetical protein
VLIDAQSPAAWTVVGAAAAVDALYTVGIVLLTPRDGSHALATAIALALYAVAWIVSATG